MGTKPKPRAKAKTTSASLVTALTRAARRAFTTIRASAPRDHFYFFALFTTDDGAYVAATAASEEGLARTAKKYAARRGDLATHLHELRFSAPDSPYHAPEIPELHRFAGPGVRAACFRALAALDDEGFFGTGAERARVVINVVYGDTSDERWLKHAQRLNPEASVAAAMPFLHLNLASGEVVEWGPGVYQANAVSLSADGAWIAYSGSGGDVGVFDPDTNAARFAKRLRGEHWASVLSPDGARLYLGHEKGARVLDLASGKTRELWSGGKPSMLAISPDGARLAAVSWDEPPAMRDATSGTIRWTVDGDTEALAFSPDGRSIARLGASGTSVIVARLDASTGEETWSVALGETRAVAIAWSPDGRTIYAGTTVWRGAGTLHVLDAKRGTVKRHVDLDGELSALCVSESGERLGLCVKRALVAIDRNGRELARGTGGHESLHACVFRGDEDVIAVGRNVNSGPVFLTLLLPD